MATHELIMGLERKFWQALVDSDIDTVVSLLDEQSVSVNARGVGAFSPAQYREMVTSSDARVTAFKFSDEQVLFPTPDVAVATYKARQTFTVGGRTHEMVVYDTTTWVKKAGRWVAAAHTETPEQKISPDA